MTEQIQRRAKQTRPARATIRPRATGARGNVPGSRARAADILLGAGAGRLLCDFCGWGSDAPGDHLFIRYSPALGALLLNMAGGDDPAIYCRMPRRQRLVRRGPLAPYRDTFLIAVPGQVLDQIAPMLNSTYYPVSIGQVDGQPTYMIELAPAATGGAA